MVDPHPIPELDRKGLRDFAVVTGGIVAGLFGLLLPWILGRPVPRWPWVILAVLTTLAILAPMALRPIYRGWMHFGLIMSRITTPLVLGSVFFLVLTPMALVMRLLGAEQLARKFDRAATTYRVRSEANPVQRLEKPF